MTRITILADEELKKELKMHAIKTGENMTDIILRLIKKELEVNK